MFSTFDAVSRRRVLAGGGLLTVLALATPGCGSTPVSPAVGELEAQRRLAHHDSELAAAAGAALPDSGGSSLGAALAAVAAERAEHARALGDEIARATGKRDPEPTETAPPSDVAAAAPTVSDVVNALRVAADSAGTVATTSSGYRAGLLASIAAACTAAYTVALVSQS